jgi:hypothetical protein
LHPKSAVILIVVESVFAPNGVEGLAVALRELCNELSLGPPPSSSPVSCLAPPAGFTVQNIYLNVFPAGAAILQITATSTQGTYDVLYTSVQFVATGGVGQYTFSESGPLPSGMTLGTNPKLDEKLGDRPYHGSCLTVCQQSWGTRGLNFALYVGSEQKSKRPTSPECPFVESSDPCGTAHPAGTTVTC